MYCLGCCWAYFLLMVALGWMNLLWMGLLAGIIFGEKIWSRGIWIARAVGVVLAIMGILVVAGMLPPLLSSSPATSMTDSQEGADDDMMTMNPKGNTNDNNNDNNMAMSESSSKARDYESDRMMSNLNS
jgi:hypothetical protein